MNQEIWDSNKRVNALFRLLYVLLDEKRLEEMELTEPEREEVERILRLRKMEMGLKSL